MFTSYVIGGAIIVICSLPGGLCQWVIIQNAGSSDSKSKCGVERNEGGVVEGPCVENQFRIISHKYSVTYK